jgi:Cdc6-like AAA superfamily ATPase
VAELAAVSNPFGDNVVQDAWQAPADVAEVHADVFQACLAGIASAARGTPDSLLIYGPAGSGKTHLLTRFQRHLVQTSKEAADQVLHCVLVFVRLQTSPQLLWQHVRRRLALDLMRWDEGLTQLQRLVAHQIAIQTHSPPRSAVRQLRVLGKEDHESVSSHLSDLAAALDLPRDLCVVLEHLLCNRGVRDASAWLMGESLPERVLAQLDLGPEEPEDREEAARSVVTALARLAGKTLPIVFCFDQVEALQRSADDQDAFFRFGRLAGDLHDADPNVFMITCLQSALVEGFDRAVRQSDRDRLAKRRIILSPLTPPQVDAIVRARLDSVPDLATLRAANPTEPFYPLASAFVAGLAQDAPVVPRRVLARCARAFEERQHGRASQRLEPREFLDSAWEERARVGHAEQSPARTTAIFLKGSEVLATIAEVSVSERDTEGADLVVNAKTKVALSLRNEADGRSLGPKLKALLACPRRQDGARWAIVRDPRLSIGKSAVKTREALDRLVAGGATIIEPTIEALAALEALSSLLADAKSGDLANEGETVAPGDVVKWLRSLRDDLRLEPIRELVDVIVNGGNKVVPAADEQDLADYLGRERVALLEVVSRELACDPTRLIDVARRNPTRFLVLEGPPTVFLDMAGVASEVEM